MSLYATWCKCKDGKWYKEPLWLGDDLGDGTVSWFLCLDDDDPPELVYQVGKAAPPIDLYRWFKASTKFGESGHRTFNLHRQGDKKWEFRKARRCFGHLIHLPPIPQIYDAVLENWDNSLIQCWINPPE
jgi:hypothetical protein